MALTRFYGTIARVDEEKRMVWGYASTAQKCSDGQTITIDALKNALDEYMEYANIREMHQLSAVGVAKEALVDDVGMYIGALVVDDIAWVKVKTEVYKAFSVGGTVLARDPYDRTIITAFQINEISLVDRGADPGAKFDVWHAAGAEEFNMTDKNAAKAAPLAKLTTEHIALLQRAGMSAEAVTGLSEAEAGVLARAITEAQGAPAAVSTDETPATVVAEPVLEADVSRAEPAAEVSAEDRMTRAMENLRVIVDNFDAGAAIARALPGDEIRRSIDLTARLGFLLAELCYVFSDARWESEWEGDASPVPAKLAEGLKTLASAYKTMAAEEIDELLKNWNVDGDLVNMAIMSRGADAIGEAQTVVLKRALDGFVTRGFALPAGAEPADHAAPSDEINRALRDENEALKLERVAAGEKAERLERSITTMAEQMEGVTERLKKIEAQPAPAKAAASNVARAIGKEQDGITTDAPTQTDIAANAEAVARAMDSLSPEERTLLLLKATYRNGGSAVPQR